MKIGICDDDAKIRNMVNKWLTSNHPELSEDRIFEFICGEALLEFLRTNTLDIVFLDCRMSGIDGIDTAKEIRKRDTKLTIIILTDFPKYALLGYDIDAFNYILKDKFYDKIDSVFQNAIKRHQEKQIIIYNIKTSDGNMKIEVQNILFIESCRRKKNIIMVCGQTYEVYSNAEDLENDLQEYGIIRIHRSFLVNSRHIIRFSANMVELVGRVILPVSRGMYKKAFDEFTVFSAR